MFISRQQLNCFIKEIDGMRSHDIQNANIREKTAHEAYQ